jgi:hypothetical protein
VETRGRESKSEREIAKLAPVAESSIPAPPDSLSVEQAEEWNLIVRSMGPSWYRKEYGRVLMSYCRQAVLSAEFHERAASFPTELRDTDTGMKQYIELTKAAERADRAVDKFATTLRLTPQSRYDKDKAARDSNRQAQRPW